MVRVPSKASLVITSFWILKPLKKSLFVEFYDQSGFNLLGWQMGAAQAELLAKVANMLVALVAAIAFAYLARWLRRQQLTYVFAAFSILGYLFYAVALQNPGAPAVWSFYLYGDLFNTLMVPTFFVFLNDSVTPGQAKRLYGVIVLGGPLGGAFGSTFVRARIDAAGGTGSRLASYTLPTPCVDPRPSSVPASPPSWWFSRQPPQPRRSSATTT